MTLSTPLCFRKQALSIRGEKSNRTAVRKVVFDTSEDTRYILSSWRVSDQIMDRWYVSRIATSANFLISTFIFLNLKLTLFEIFEIAKLKIRIEQRIVTL